MVNQASNGYNLTQDQIDEFYRKNRDSLAGERNRRPAVLAKFGHLESIPAAWDDLHVNVANASTLTAKLSRERDRPLLFRTLATLRTDIALFDDVDELRWAGPTPGLDMLAARFDAAITETKQSARRRLS
ncbi:MAG TPA: hypothetical protein VGG72_00050 [Bryobacteraceae bacterium]|jgi:hypothetical protein